MSLFHIEFDKYDHDFCEASIYNTGSEYINSLSALFISFIGIFGLYYNTDYCLNISMLYYSLIINGITSCIYHHTHYIGWGLLDRYSMIYISTYCYNIFLSLLFSNNAFFTHLSRLSIVIYLTILSTVAGLHQELMFNNLFGFFLFTILLFLITLRMIHSNLPKIIFYYGLKGIALISVAGISWIITENLCNKYSIMKYLFGHAIWHIAVSLGGYYISLIPIYLSKKAILHSIITIKYKYNIPYISE